MKEKEEFYYKICCVNGRNYLQIWKRNSAEDKNSFVRSLGTATSLNKKLVKYEERENQTKEMIENLTNF